MSWDGAVKALKNSNAEGPDHISTRCIKKLRKPCVEILFYFLSLEVVGAVQVQDGRDNVLNEDVERSVVVIVLTLYLI